MNDPIIGYRLFLDGTRRPIFEQLDGRQYVLDDDDERVYGVWTLCMADQRPRLSGIREVQLDRAPEGRMRRWSREQ